MAKKAVKSKTTKKPARRKIVGRSFRPGFYFLLILSFFVLVFLWCLEPTQNWLRQRREIGLLTRQISTVKEENRRLEEEKTALNTPEKIEELAREDFGMVKPGEEAYVVIPPEKSSKPPTSKPNPKEPTIWEKIKSYLDKL